MNGEAAIMETKILPVDARKFATLTAIPSQDDMLDSLRIDLNSSGDEGATHLEQAAAALRTSNIPVAFPTETVYGLGADATRSEAVRGIYRAKQRPADNPLIVHFASLGMLRGLLRGRRGGRGVDGEGVNGGAGSGDGANGEAMNGEAPNGLDHDPIPAIYRPLISRFWPGPLTIILPNPTDSLLAPEVTGGLDTFGARIPRHALALALITLADKPIAAPSANASTKPSPTAAEHVAYDLDGRIEMILDGGPCDVGVESTVVTGLTNPPRMLRPGGISLEQIRSCPGWEQTEIGYKNLAETDGRPTAPGMKYRHYSPKATVVLYEHEKAPPGTQDLREAVGSSRKVGVITTKRWRVLENVSSVPIDALKQAPSITSPDATGKQSTRGFAGMLETLQTTPDPRKALNVREVDSQSGSQEPAFQILDIALGADNADIARGIFSALREMDRSGADTIFVEGIDETEGDTAAAIMNRLRKASEVRVAD